eukprot:CAMPEP_0172483314 /NCGR_PEP_ID=MMETSP1066-20121228/10271_1 /TAXON_ID=671091 /ORGANISM="Coscinodiscus wailesii, Strain CCMP2513" /LENGTH=106 /DNA_ID=CAMNT_0013247121 /DNA_START=1648 /DNA_END=1969 /DNA_ORIENTATION=+
MRDDNGSNVLAMIFSKSDLDDLSVNEVSCLMAAPDRTSEKIPDANHNKAVTRPSKMNQLHISHQTNPQQQNGVVSDFGDATMALDVMTAGGAAIVNRNESDARGAL